MMIDMSSLVSKISTCWVISTHSPLFSSFQVREMASPPTRFGNPVKMQVELLTVIDARENRAYRRIMTYVMVDEGLGELVTHPYEAWYRLTDGEWIGPLGGFSGPFAGRGGSFPGQAEGGA